MSKIKEKKIEAKSGSFSKRRRSTSRKSERSRKKSETAKAGEVKSARKPSGTKTKGSSNRKAKRPSDRIKRKYLGTIVPDLPPSGLSSRYEVASIVGAIMAEYRHRRISRHTAGARLALLKLVAKHQGVLSRPLSRLIDEAISEVKSSG